MRLRGEYPLRAEPTRRELEVLLAVLRGGSRSAAAHHLGISERTVEHHLTRLRRRTGLETTMQAVFVFHDRLLDLAV